MTETKRITRCRVLGKHANPCTGEAVDPDGELLICPRHLAMAFRMLNAAKAKVAGKASIAFMSIAETDAIDGKPAA